MNMEEKSKKPAAEKLGVAFPGQIEYDKLSKEWKLLYEQGA